MLAATYDPQNIADDAFDTDNHTDGTTNKVYTATEKTKLAGIETAADVTDSGNVGSSIHGASAKTTPGDADTIPLIDSAASNVLKKVTWANIKATIQAALGIVNAGVSGQLAYFATSAAAVSGNAKLTYSNAGGTPRLTIGESGDAASLALTGDTSGSAVIQAAAVASGVLTPRPQRHS